MRGKTRLLVWYDRAGNITQAAVAPYVNEDKQWEHTWTPAPFSDIVDVEAEAFSYASRQPSLFDTLSPQ